MNTKSWTDKDLSIPREEWGKNESAPTNNTSSHYNSEHYYNEQGNRPITYGTSNIPGYESSEHYYNEGVVFGKGYSINGEKVSDLIEKGLLSKKNIKPEEKEIVCKDILCGVTRNKNMLAAKLDLIIDDKSLVDSILLIQYREAIKEINSEKRTKISSDVVNRKFQFLATTKILMEKGYELDKLLFAEKGPKDFIEMLSEFKNQSSGSKPIEDASWFKDGVAPEGYDFRKVNSAFLFSSSLLGELYKKNPNAFKEKYENYKSNTSLEPISFEEFMERYGVFENDVNELEHGKMHM